jgi:hypothetical protein
MEGGGDIRHPGDAVRLPFQQSGQLALKQAVLFGFFRCNFFVNSKNKNVLPIV